ncbi:MAG: TolC family protein [Polyangiaceae bacterium]|nr:TolC family protein [Polyangiaceae bacterium]
MGALALVSASPANAAPSGTMSLARILELADNNHPNVLAARARLKQVRAQLDEAHFAPFSQFKLTGGVTLAPNIRGNNIFSPNTDASLTSNLGVAWRVGIDGIIPLWTFGKITNLWDAAAANVKVHEAGIEKERDAVRYDVRKAFFGLRFARDALHLLVDVKKELAKAESRAAEAADGDDGDPIDLAQVQAISAEIEAREAEAERYEKAALTGLRFYTGVATVDIDNIPLGPPKHPLGHVTRYLTAARLYRPEVQMVRAGIDARQAQVRMARSALYPDVGLLLQAGISAAPEIANVLNPYVADPGNYFRYGAALVFQWKLDFLPADARVRFADAQLEEMRATEQLALGGVGTEVEIAYDEAIDWRKRSDAYTKAVSASKRWLILVSQGIDVGTKEAKDLIEPAKSYALNKVSQLNALYEYNLAMARLAKATGWDALAPDGEPDP